MLTDVGLDRKKNQHRSGIYILAPGRGGNFFVQVEKRKNLKEDFMKKGREKGGKAEKRKE